MDRKSILVVLGLVLVGCGRQPKTTVEQADLLFAEGHFDEAIQLIDNSLDQVKFVEDQVTLLTLKGRCYWEKTAVVQRADETQKLLQLSVAALTQSIDAMDSAEARHLRSLVYEKLGQAELARADQEEWRRLDEAYRSAYLNEPAEKVLLTLDQERLAESEAAVKTQAATAKAEWQPPRADKADQEEVEPWAEAGSVPSVATPSVPSPDTRSPEGGGRQAGLRSDGLSPGRTTQPASRLYPSWPTSGNSVSRQGDHAADPMADEFGPDDAAGDEAGESPDDADSEPTPPADDETATPTRPRLPGSTWQPWRIDNSTIGRSPGLGPLASPLAPPTTGIVGPLGGTVIDPAGAADTATRMPAAPTTGITGPPGSSVGESDPGDGLLAAPTTGITAPPRPVMPSGFPTQWSPTVGRSAAGPSLPFTGAMPTNMQSRNFGSALPTGNLPTTGPHYSPLRPSPLTAPAGVVNRGLPVTGAMPTASSLPGSGALPAGASPASSQPTSTVKPPAKAPAAALPPYSVPGKPVSVSGTR